MSASTALSVSDIFSQDSDNEFKLSDHKSATHVTLSLDRRGPLVQGSNDNVPSLQYQGTEGTLSFSGSQVVTETTALGRMFTVTLNIVPDLRTLSFTVLVSTVAHSAGQASQAFDTIAIKSERHVSLQRTPTTAGAEMTYTVVKMSGTATKVEVPA